MTVTLEAGILLRPTMAEGMAETIDGFATVIDDCR